MRRTLHDKPQPQTPDTEQTSDTGTKRKVLVSFLSYDQDNWEIKNRDESFLRSFLLPKGAVPGNRNEIWRPSVALAQLHGLDELYRDLIFDHYYLLWDEKDSHRKLMEEIRADIESLEPHPELHVENPGITMPFETKDVYQKLFEYLAKYDFHQKDTQYYVNCTNGTTQMRNCLFLLTQTGHIDALRIAPTPWKNHKQRDRPRDGTHWKEDGRRTVKGSYTLEDPKDFSDAFSTIGENERKTTISILKQGVVTKDDSKLQAIAKVICGIKRIRVPAVRARQTILITGDTGVGKTQLAQNIAMAFDIPKERFIALNCATIRGADPNIQRIELFGCKKGVVSGIDEDRPGAFEKANEGVLFLDEIGDLAPEMQAMLLTALDQGEFLPLGGDVSKPAKSTFQLICGTNRPIEQLAETGSFRLDLLNRINAWSFELAPLRERRKDIPDNIVEVMKGLAKDYRMNGLEFTPEAKKLFFDFANDEEITWDGNFRELNAMIRRMVVLSDGFRITEDIVNAELDAARKRYRRKRERAQEIVNRGIRRNTANLGDDNETPPRATFPFINAVSYEETYAALSRIDQAELGLLVKAIRNEHITSQQGLCRQLYGDKMTPSGLSKRLKAKFKLRFAHGRLEPVQ